MLINPINSTLSSSMQSLTNSISLTTAGNISSSLPSVVPGLSGLTTLTQNSLSGISGVLNPLTVGTGLAVPSLTTALTSSISNSCSSISSTITAQLHAALPGLNPADLVSVSNLSNNLVPTSIATSIVASTAASIAESQNKLLVVSKALATSSNQDALTKQSPTIVQDAAKGIRTPEMPVISSTFSNVPDQPIGSSSLNEDYPNTEGSIDEAKNWFKINKKSGYVEFVHNSGSYLKIDKAGNGSIYFSGGLKLMVAKDFLINALGNLDLHTLGNLSNQGITIQTDATTLNITSTNTNILSQETSITGPLSVSNDISIGGLLHGGGPDSGGFSYS